MYYIKPTVNYSLITGASSGIGKAMAQECARRSMNIILVALDNDDLYTSARELADDFPSVEVITLPADLSNPDAAQVIYNYCRDKKLTVNVLINNAAIGASGRFDSHTASFHAQTINVNLMTPLLLTRFFLADFRQFEKAYILNVSSAAAFFDMPYKTIYASTKSFIYSFSRSLREELKGTDISVSTMCSGGVVTNEETKKRTEELGYLSKKLQLTALLVASKGIQGMLDGKALILPGNSSKLFFLLSFLFPYRIKLRILSKFYGRVYASNIPIPPGTTVSRAHSHEYPVIGHLK